MIGHCLCQLYCSLGHGNKMNLPWALLLVLLSHRQLLPWLRTVGETSLNDFYSEAQAKLFLQFYEQTAQVVLNEFMEATWNYVTNITKQNQKNMDVKRMLRKLQNIDKSALPTEDLLEVTDRGPGRPGTHTPAPERRYNRLLTYMETAYNRAEVCLDEGPCLTLEPDLQEIMATSRDQKELLWAWQGWRDAVGRQLRPVFEDYVRLSNKAAQYNGYKDMGALWRSKYESDTLEEDLEQLYKELQPLYLNLHAYVRRSLYRYYGPELIDLRGPIPAHLLGNMWAQSWNNILDLVLPYPTKAPEDITAIMKIQHWRPEKMFEEANLFFTSMGMLPAPPAFWIKSMMEKPADGREVECHTSSWNFYKFNDFRVKKCTEVTLEDLLSVFHQMGHIQYFLQYQNLSVIYQEGASPAFEEAVGSVIALSVSSHKYLLARGLLSQPHQDSEEEVNFLLGIALEKIAFIPFSYLVDKFRWKIFDGTISKITYNQEWWNFRLKYQGLCPPVPRSDDDFDPGAKFHIPANVPYIRYFLGLILQFQLHEALCEASGHVGPLHQCDNYNSKVAGKILGDLLKLGSSRPWREVLQEVTGESNISTKAFLTYFKPLMDWLVTENVKQGDTLGWPDFSCSFEEKITSKVSFLGTDTEPEQAYLGQWVLLSMSFFMLVLILALGFRLHYLEKQLLDEDTMILKTLPYSYFLGIAMEPHQAARKQWLLLGLCCILMLCCIGLLIRIVTQNTENTPWMKNEGQS
ncbi:angiotensin-converting enzyme-like protein Ace3 isoform X3 [Mus musculus]|uniref:angiotensin-converting enzyme-like protein Ace3 isoform X3 n=1 Tax=Mus musculus TaxID=10090 RepID=UPI0003D71088|nr:angiotensin-converting enzyme-like protein Ace3 isoform X3 [Mus musculus]|eukprot:XP_006533119.1 PREDICTED: angiotensin I converting enzyme 3 isoform X4 [Mus musculus]